MPTAQAQLFPPPQGDLFGVPAPAAPAAYVVPYPIAVNTLARTLEQLTQASRWPWDADMKAARMQRNTPKMLAVLPLDEAERWRGLIEAQAARLDAAEPAPEPPARAGPAGPDSGFSVRPPGRR